MGQHLVYVPEAAETGNMQAVYGKSENRPSFRFILPRSIWKKMDRPIPS